MTKEELLEKVKEIENTYSQEERIKLLEDIKNALKDANQELRDLYLKTKEEMDKNSIEEARKKLGNA